MGVDARFILNMRGKDFVLFAGLLDLAHTQSEGQLAIETQIVADMCSPEKDRWVVQATGTFPGETGLRVWSAYGDADPGNSQMKGSYLRHAETRAIARMLRMATNVGMTAFEELGGEDEPRNGSGSTGAVRTATGPAPAARPVHVAAPAPATNGKAAVAPDPAAESVPLVCQVPACAKPLTKGQATLSQHKHKLSLCPDCSKKADQAKEAAAQHAA